MYASYEDLPRLSLPLGQEVFVSDSTLRDGAQMPGVVIKVKDRIKIFEYLHRIGIDKLELFLFTKSDKEYSTGHDRLQLSQARGHRLGQSQPQGHRSSAQYGWNQRDGHLDVYLGYSHPRQDGAEK